MVVADRFELSLPAYQTGFLPLKEATVWVEHRESNPNLQSHKLPCCRYTMNHMFVSKSTAICTASPYILQYIHSKTRALYCYLYGTAVHLPYSLVAGPRVELGLTGLWGPFGNRSSLQCWCLIRESNPEKTDFESVMSAGCINQTNGTPTTT